MSVMHKWILAVTMLVLTGGCAGLEQALEDRKPKVSVDGMRLAAVDFDRARVVFDVAIDNPNPVGIDLAGFDYVLRLGGNEFLSGKRDRALRLPPDGRESIAIPLDIPFARVAELPGELRGRQSVDYGLDLGLDFELPALGRQRLGTSTTGKMPIPQRPGISLEGVRVAELGLSGAELVLELGIDNPNDFGIDLDRLVYALAINGRRWAGSSRETNVSLAADGRSAVELPLKVNFGTIGAGAYELLRGGASADYRFTADVIGNAGLEGFGAFDVPIERSGRINLAR